jgi:5-methylcytosine-specific restriction endonuclease McrA
MMRACPHCGGLMPIGGTCPRGCGRPAPRGEWRAEGSTRAWRKLRAQALARDGHRCTHLDPLTGLRCPERHGLEVHHLDGGAPLIVPLDRLATLCRTHHHEADR